VISTIRAGGYDLAVVFPKSFESALWVTMGGVPRRAGFAAQARSLLLTAAALLLGTVLLFVAQMVAAPFGRLDAFLRRPLIRVAALIAMAVVIEVVVRTMIPGKPTPLLLAVPLLCLAPPAMVLLARHLETPLGRGLVSGGLVLLGALIALFPWGARQLSQF
jgi:hypothetical protein